MPDAAVMDAPAVETAATPRDDRGRFTSTGQRIENDPSLPVEDAPAAPAPPVEPEPETTPVETPPGAETAAVPPGQAPRGLGLEDAEPPVFGQDLKFIGDRFLGKYETVDDALQAVKSQAKRIGQLEYELAQARAGNGAPSGEPPPYVYDPHTMTPEKLAEQIAKDIGGKDSFDERVEFEENPNLYIAKKMVAATQSLNKKMGATRAWEAVTRESYTTDHKVGEQTVKGMSSKLYDQAFALGDLIYAEFLHPPNPKIAMGPAELRVKLGLGELARQGMLSDDKPVTRTVPVGRAPETAAVVAAPVARTTDPRAEQKAAIARMRKASYG